MLQYKKLKWILGFKVKKLNVTEMLGWGFWGGTAPSRVQFKDF